MGCGGGFCVSILVVVIVRVIVVILNVIIIIDSASRSASGMVQRSCWLALNVRHVLVGGVVGVVGGGVSGGASGCSEVPA